MIDDAFREVIYRLNEPRFVDDDEFKKLCFNISSAPKHVLNVFWKHSTEHSSTRFEVLFLFRDMLDTWKKLSRTTSNDS